MSVTTQEYKPVSERRWFNKLHSLDNVGKDITGVDEEMDQLTINTTVIEWMMDVEDNGGLVEIFLLNEFKNQFADWPRATFARIHTLVTKAMKELFQSRGIYMAPSRDSINKQLKDLMATTQCQPWPEDELELMKSLYPGFRCRQMINSRSNSATTTPRRATATPQRTAEPRTPTRQRQPESTEDPQYPPLPPSGPLLPPASITTHQPNHDQQTISGQQTAYGQQATGGQQAAHGQQPTGVHIQQPAVGQIPNSGRDLPFVQQQQQQPEQTMPTRCLADLTKLYSDDKKFSGDLHDVLSLKLNIFYDLCGQVGVTQDRYHDAFSIMLRGKAQDFYYQHLARKGFSFVQMIDRIKAYFHTPETHQLYLNEWRTTLLKDIIASNPDKDISQCLEIVIERLQRTYQGLVQNFGGGEGSLAGQLVSACQGVEACQTVLVRPASSFEAIAADLRSAVGIWKRCQPAIPQYHIDPGPDTFYTNRRYNRTDGRQHGPRGRTGPGSNSHIKRCFVCGKTGCWSTRHPMEERKRSRRRFNTYAQDNNVDSSYEAFLASFEGTDTGDDSDVNPDSDLDTYYTQSSQQFNTACGIVNGQEIAILLNNNATAHAVTGEDPQSVEAMEETHMFTFDARYGGNTFQGIMPDTGAAGISTAGMPQVKALQLLQPTVVVNTATANQQRIRFGNGPELSSTGSVNVTTPFGVITFAVMPTNTPFLLCLADMDRHGVYFNNVDNLIVHNDNKYPIVRKWGHPWLLLDSQQMATYFLTEVELRQIHRRFGHPTVARLSSVLEKAGYEDIDKEIISRINKYCHQCQINSKAPGRFKFTIRDDANFNYRIIVDVMYINSKPVLHAVDEATAFQAARFLSSMTASTIWNTLRTMWIDMYIGPPDTIATDAGKNFVSEEFINNANSMAIEILDAPVEAHNSVGKVERYHATIRRAFEVITADTGQAVPPEDRLQMAVKAVNDTAGPDGLVPTLLVFGTYPRLSKTSPPSPSITARANAVRKAMDEVRKIKAKRQVDDALASRNGPDVSSLLELPIPSEVKVWREKDGWTGPHQMVGFNDEKTAVTVIVNGRPVTFRTTVVQEYCRDGTTQDNTGNLKD